MPRTKIFFDMEFTGLHQNTTLISIGCIADNDRTFYFEFDDYDKTQVNDWIQENVINRLRDPMPFPNSDARDTDHFRMKGEASACKYWLEVWLKSFNNDIEMWSDCLAYDWILFNHLWGHAFNIPECVYYIPFDICTLFKVKDIDPDINREFFAQVENDSKHDALWDAQIIKKCYEKLITIK